MTSKDLLLLYPGQNGLGTKPETKFVSSKSPMSTSFYCYILECADGTYYTGWTTDPERRLRQHNAGRGARYTQTRRPVQLVYVESQPDRSTAQKREIKIKKLSRAQKEVLVNKAIGN